MFDSISRNWALFVGILLLMMANGLLVTLLSVRATEIGMSPSAIGLMQAGYPLGALAGCILAPRLIAGIGHVRTFAALGSLCSVTAIVHLLSSDPWTWGAMRLLAGFCFPGLYVVCESWLNAKSENRSRASILSVYFVIQTIGVAVGQALAGASDPTGAVLFGLASILISLSFLPILLSSNPQPDYVPPTRMSLMRLAAVSPTGVMGALLNGVSQAAIYIGLPLHGLALGMTVADATLLVVAATLAGAVSQFPLGWLSDRIDRRIVVAVLSLIGALTSICHVAGLFSDADHLAAAILGAATLPIYSLCVAYANDRLSTAEIVPASGTLVLSLNMGLLAGSFVGPVSIGVGGPSGLFLFLGLTCGATAAVAVSRRLRTAPVTSSGSAQPIAVQGVQTTGSLYPADLPPEL